MFLHLGEDISVAIKDIIAIIDVNAIEKSKNMKEFLYISEDNKAVFSISDLKPKSYVIVYDSNKRYILYKSPISSSTLLKRSKSLNNFATQSYI